jgi:hypothetical protein
VRASDTSEASKCGSGTDSNRWSLLRPPNPPPAACRPEKTQALNHAWCIQRPLQCMLQQVRNIRSALHCTHQVRTWTWERRKLVNVGINKARPLLDRAYQVGGPAPAAEAAQGSSTPPPSRGRSGPWLCVGWDDDEPRCITRGRTHGQSQELAVVTWEHQPCASGRRAIKVLTSTYRWELGATWFTPRICCLLDFIIIISKGRQKLGFDDKQVKISTSVTVSS